MSAALEVLAKNLLSAEAGSRALDCCIAEAIYPEMIGWRGPFWDVDQSYYHPKDGRIRVELYSESIDSAIDLALVKLPGWTIARINQNDDKSWHAEMRKGHLTSYSSVVLAGGNSKYNPGLPNGAIALCLCIVRAMLIEAAQ